MLLMLRLTEEMYSKMDISTGDVSTLGLDEGAIVKFANDLSYLLKKSVSITPLNAGVYGTGYKLSVEGGEDVVLKVFHKTNLSHGDHGRYAEPQAGLFANAHSNQFVKMYCGQVAGREDLDGYLITQYLGDGVEPLESQAHMGGYNVTSSDYDPAAGHNMINGKIIDFGGLNVEKFE